MQNPLFSTLFCWILILLTGCAVPQSAIEHRHWTLNDSIRQTGTEQLLLNIVRLRYDEKPYFLQVSSISTQFSASSNVGTTSDIVQEGSNQFGLTVGISYSEAPVVTWAIPDSREFLGRLYAPLGADQLTVLTQAGLDIPDVLRTGTKKINKLRNLEFDIRKGTITTQGYDKFIEALELIETLRKEDLADLAYALMSNYGGGKFSTEKLDTRAIAEGIPSRLFFLQREDRPATIEPRVFSNPLFLRFSKASDSDNRAIRLRELLNLNEKRYSFPIINTANASPELLRTEAGGLSLVYDPDVKLDQIMLNNRSMMEILRFASANINVPEEDLKNKYVRDVEGTERDWLNIFSSKEEPVNAWLKVKYNGNWFYIKADDLESRTTFTLLDALFASVVGNVPGGKPVLTMPVK